MDKVCMVVLNSVTYDTRVLKEATSLSNNGYNVTIVGVRDDADQTPFTRLNDKFRIVRVPYYPLIFAKSNLLWVMIALIVTVFLILPFGLLNASAEFFLNIVAYTILVIAILNLTLLRFSKKISEFKEKYYNRKKIKTILLLNLLDILQKPNMFIRVIQGMVSNLFVILALTRQVLKEKPKILHCHDVESLPVSFFVKKIKGCKVIYDAHEVYEELAGGDRISRLKFRLIHKLFLRYVDEFITINESIKNWYKINYPKLCPANVIMNAAEKKKIAPYDGRLHECVNLPKDTKIILYQGGYARHRGLKYLIRSASYLPSDWALVLMGSGAYGAEIRELNGKLGNKNVYFAPKAPQNELLDWTSGATLGVIPYRNVSLNHYYCTPNKIWEYSIASVPIIANKLFEIKNIISKYNNGWLLDMENSYTELSEFIINLNDKKYNSIRKGCSNFIASNNWEIYEQKLLSIYAKFYQKDVKK
ncbi:glycosyltransferase [Dethiosulfatarculus sandiegensis]|uniref:Uncharacterized protein n=1 Tax=Dethiosulfatarculus sandiegensis TaxID=1429043 RepID=A0A0D2J010_9BACT|nr:glycosyltransferase [Dethiosulfatarculus sandiegensis]KIX11554.1 hypothetical protein X474_24300 [Dethiosulfatarculus sandiegensis]